eukprot:jgi/Mesvir1/8217/Mv12507-RA.1
MTGRWVVAIVAVKFDLERGQIIEHSLPPDAIPAEEAKNVAFSAFPDSMSGPDHGALSVRDSVFFFRIARHTDTPSPAPSPGTEKHVGTAGDRDAGGIHKAGVESMARSVRAMGGWAALDYMTGGSAKQEFLYGYVFCRQWKDSRLKRGGEQKSVVVLSSYPLTQVFRPLSKIAGPLYFDKGPGALEIMLHEVQRWPAPVPGAEMELRTCGITLRAYIPSPATFWHNQSQRGWEEEVHTDAANGEEGGTGKGGKPELSLPTNMLPVLGIFHDTDLFGIFKSVLLQLWTLFELVLVGEPVLIVAPTPAECSEAVASLLSLLEPLPCGSDFRPYFTIHDPMFRSLAAWGRNPLPPGKEPVPLPSKLLGVTNLFFLKSLRWVPHIVSVGTPPSSGPHTLASATSTAGARPSTTPSQDDSPGSPRDGGSTSSALRRLTLSRLVAAVRARQQGALSLVTQHTEAVWSPYTPVLKPDTAVLNRLIDPAPFAASLGPGGGAGGGMVASLAEAVSASMVNNDLLRRHFCELMHNFLAPFGPYLRPVAPPRSMSVFSDPPPLLPFDPVSFLAKLAERGPGKFLAKRTRAGNSPNGGGPLWLSLYARFLSGPHFGPWFAVQRAHAQREMLDTWHRARLALDVAALIRGPPGAAPLSELTLMDAFARVEKHLVAELAHSRARAMAAGAVSRRGSLSSSAGVDGNDSGSDAIMGGDREDAVAAALEDAMCRKLRADLWLLHDALPTDMQQMLLFTPARAALLQAPGHRVPMHLPGHPTLLATATRAQAPGSGADRGSSTAAAATAAAATSRIVSNGSTALPSASPVPALIAPSS